MAFEIFDKDEVASVANQECVEMFASLTHDNYAVSDLKASLIRQQAKLQNYKVSVTARPKDTTYIVKLKKN